MRELDADEAAKHLSSLLDAVAGGETIVMTRRGKPVACLVPATGSEEEVGVVMSRMKAARSSRGSMSLQEILAALNERRR